MNDPAASQLGEGPDVVVVGAGTMGAGIAQSFVTIGARVALVERAPDAAERALASIRRGLERQWRDDPEAAGLVTDALERLVVVDEPQHWPGVTLVIEAVPENVELKCGVITSLAPLCPGAVIATNTSSLSITELGAVLADPTRFVGMHFFNPVPRSDLIEVVVSPQTSDETLSTVQTWSSRLDKTVIVVQDSPGFATSRLGLALGLEAIRMVEQGVASAEDIDRGMTLGYKHPIGPLRLTDMVGLDVRLGIAEHLAGTLGERFEPPQLLRDMVAAGKLGKKSGEGFYRWD